MTANVLLMGTCDTKLEELLFLRDQICEHNGVKVILIDVGRAEVKHEAIFTSQRELVHDFGGGRDTSQLARGELIEFMSNCATKYVKKLYEDDIVHGAIAAGGSGNTSLASAVMRDALPIGFPKLIVSTIASGDTGPIVGESDIALMYSVVDIAGLNQILRAILTNAGVAIAAAAFSYAARQKVKLNITRTHKKRVGITMFGVTTPAVDAIRHHLETKYPVETYIFHATGHGGKSMEKLVRQGQLDAVLDLTTTEICDFITGGVMSAGGHRLEAAAEAGIPCIISLGATDMVNFGPRSTVPEKYTDRLLYDHNPVVTLMRTSRRECRQVGEFICSKLKGHARRPERIQVWLPKGGVSMLSTPGGPFANAEADAVLFKTIRQELEGSSIETVEDPRHINDEGFARDIAEALAAKFDFINPDFGSP